MVQSVMQVIQHDLGWDDVGVRGGGVCVGRCG